MRKTLLTLTVWLSAIAAAAQTAPQSQPAAQPGQAAAPAPAAPAQQKKEIKDPAEYNAYMAAVQATDPNQKAASFEGFLNQYPNSVMKEDALETLMATYQQTGNLPKTQETAQRLLQVSPNNVRALALLAYLARAQAEGGQNAQQNAQAAGEYGRRGLQALQAMAKPEGTSDADWQKFQNQVKEIFAGSIGFSALQAKDYAAAAQALQQAVELGPNSLQNVYPLALSYLEQKPINPIGLWYGARAVNLAANSPQAHQVINKYVQARYIRYHGGDDGYQELLQTAAQSPAPPANFQIAPAPTPAEQAAKLVQTKQVKDMSFDEIQLVLTSGNQQAADQVWTQIKDKPIAMVGKLISGAPDKLMIAGSFDDIEANKADIELTMVAPIPAKVMPPMNGEIKFQGNPVTYEPNPFMVHMEKGTLIADKAAAAEKPAAGKAKKAPPKKKSTKKK